MATYKLIQIATGNVENIIVWDGVSEYDVPSGYELVEVTSSFTWDGNYGEASSSMSTPYSGDFIGRLYGSSSYALTASYALNGGGGGGTGSVDLDNVDHITFDTTPTAAVSEGTFVWNDGDGTLDFGLKGGNVTLQLGQQQYAMVYNAETQSLVKGDVVYISGSHGQRIQVKKASSQTENLSKNTVGFVAETIAAGSEGFVLLDGVLHGLNTTSSLEGSTLYLSTTAGQYTTTKPTAPTHTVILGFLERSHQSAGSIFVKVDNGYELGELHNVVTNGATSGDLLNYDGSVWTHSKSLTGNYQINGGLVVNGPTNYGVVKVIGSSTNSEAAISFRSTNISDGGVGQFAVGTNMALLGTGQFGIWNANSTNVYPFVIDPLTNYVGININKFASENPQYNLDVDGTANIQNGLSVSGSLNVSGSITGSLYGSASYATSASYVPGIKSGVGNTWQDSGPGGFDYVVVFNNAYSNNNYSVSVVGEDLRAWSIASKSSTGFTIKSNSTMLPSGNVYWTAVPFNS